MSDAFCPLPWMHLATHPHGGLSLCCQSEMAKGLSVAARQDGTDPITLNDTSLEEMINSRVFRDVRVAMLKGEKHPACGPCWDREAHGVESKRQYEMGRYPFSLAEARARTAADGTITPSIQFAELRLGNVCNMKCVTCNPNSSIQYAREHNQMLGRPGLEFLRDYSWVTPNMSDWTEDPEFWDELSVASPDLQELYINGGEPMLIRRHADYLERLVASGRASNVRLSYSLNLTKLIEPLREVWPRFKEVHFSCSVDDWDQRNFYIRFPAVWAQITENFAKLRSWGFRPSVLQTVSALNFFYLDEFYLRWQGLFPNTWMNYNEVVDPPWFSPLILPPQLRREVLNRLQQTLPAHLMQKLESLYGADDHSPEHWDKFVRHLAAYDEMRDTDVRAYFPELQEFLAKRGLKLA